MSHLAASTAPPPGDALGPGQSVADFLSSAPSATFAGLNELNPVTLDGTLGGTWGEVDVGVDAPINKTLSLYGSAFYDDSIDGGQSWSAGGRIGIKLASRPGPLTADEEVENASSVGGCHG